MAPSLMVSRALLAQAQALDELLAELGGKINVVPSIEVPQDVLVARLLNRAIDWKDARTTTKKQFVRACRCMKIRPSRCLTTMARRVLLSR